VYTGKMKVSRKCSIPPINPSCWQTAQEQGNLPQWWSWLHQRSYSPTSWEEQHKTTRKMLCGKRTLPEAQVDRRAWCECLKATLRHSRRPDVAQGNHSWLIHSFIYSFKNILFDTKEQSKI
jgi:hypothetical protein